MKKIINVTQPFLPPLEEFIPYLEEIWSSRWLTNNGPMHQRLESDLAVHLGIENISLFTNGTIALLTALQHLRITGEVITTPYSFVATSHSLIWNALTPVFVDIEPDTFNIDPDKIESAITSRTTAILAVHCYGNPCKVEAIQKIADNYGLKVIYDAAHAFGVNYKNRSVLSHGDLSVLSFHATKVFNTFEGGAIVSADKKSKQRIDYLKNFGFADEITVTAPGINGKMSEINAAFGLLQLKYVDFAIEQRKKYDSYYRELLKDIDGIVVPSLSNETVGNFSYFPILVESEFKVSRDTLYEILKEHGVMSRRYFYPLISDMPMYRGLPSASASNLPVAKSISEKVLCLPLFSELTTTAVEDIVSIIKGV